MTDRYGLRSSAGGFFAAGALALTVACLTDSLLLVSATVVAFFVCGTALQAGISGTVSKSGPSPYSKYVTSADFGSATGPLLGWLAYDWFALPWLGLAIGAVLFAFCSTVAWTGREEGRGDPSRAAVN